VEVRVQLQNEAGYVVDAVFSDSQGNFTFQAVHDGVYHVFVDDKRFRRTEVTAHVSWYVTPVQSVVIGLEPRGTPSKPAPPDAGAGPTISVKELRAKFPKKAVKEYEKGNSRMERGDAQGAIAHYEKALALAPEMHWVLNNLGNAYLQTNQVAKAEDAFRRAVAADPAAADPYLNLGHLLYETHRYSQAEQMLRQGLQRNPRAALGYFFLGLTDARTGKVRDAEENLQEALDQGDPRVVSAHLILAELYMKTQPGKARHHLEEYLRIRPEDPQADRIRRALARLKGRTAP
jgi:tetratricopeptide (TPR) repeat protein